MFDLNRRRVTGRIDAIVQISPWSLDSRTQHARVEIGDRVFHLVGRDPGMRIHYRHPVDAETVASLRAGDEVEIVYDDLMRVRRLTLLEIAQSTGGRPEPTPLSRYMSLRLPKVIGVSRAVDMHDSHD